MVTPHMMTPDAYLYLVVLEEAPPPESIRFNEISQNIDPAEEMDGRITALTQELRVKEESKH